MINKEDYFDRYLQKKEISFRFRFKFTMVTHKNVHQREKKMYRLISDKKAEKILQKYREWIFTVANRYKIPASVIQAILYKEMTEIDLMDLAADLIVWTGLTRKKDSSTGYAQIFGYVGLNAINFAVDKGITDYASLGIKSNVRLDRKNQKDVRMIWKLLYKNQKANIEIAALNLLSAAEEMTGRIDFPGYTEEELKLVLTRYNANVKHVTSYGEKAYQHYLRYQDRNEG